MARISTDILPDYNSWSKEDWVEFHQLLKQKFGLKDANRVWSSFFNNKPVGWTLDRVYTADEGFKSYFKSQGITFSPTFYSKISDFGHNLTSMIASLPKAVKIGGTVVIILGVAGITYIVYKGIKNAVSYTRSSQKGAKKILENPETLLKLV